MQIKPIYIFFFLLLPFSLIGQQQLTLADAIKIGLKNNFDIKIAELRTDIATQNNKVGVPQRLPSIDLRLDQDNRLSLDSSPTSFTDGAYTKSDLTASVNLDWVLFDGFQVRINKNRLNKLEELSHGNSQLVIETSTQAIILAYYQALVEREKLLVIAEVAKVSKSKLATAKNKLRYGNASQYDYYNLENAILADSINYYEQEIVYNTALVQLKYLIGLKNKKPIELSDNLEFKFNTYELPTLKRQLISNNKDIKNQYLNLALIDQSTALMKAQRKPQLRLGAGLAEELGTSKFRTEDRINGGVFDFYVRFSLSYNLFDGGEMKQRIQEMDIESLIANQEVEKVKNTLSEQLEINYENYTRTQKILELKKQLILNLEKNLDLTKDRYDAGMSLFIEYRDMQIQLLQAKFDELESIMVMKMVEVEILRLVGGVSRHY